MKYIIASLLLMLYSFTIQAQQQRHIKQFTINIWDADYAAYTRQYTITNDRLVVKGIGGLVNEEAKLLQGNRLTPNQQQIIYSFFNAVNIDTLKGEYTNPLLADGQQVKIQFTLYGHPAKTVVLQNYYQKNVNHLFNLVNQMLLPALAISYRNED